MKHIVMNQKSNMRNSTIVVIAILIIALAHQSEAAVLTYSACVAACSTGIGAVLFGAGAGPLGFVASTAGCVTTYCVPLLFSPTP